MEEITIKDKKKKSTDELNKGKYIKNKNKPTKLEERESKRYEKCKIRRKSKNNENRIRK